MTRAYPLGPWLLKSKNINLKLHFLRVNTNKSWNFSGQMIFQKRILKRNLCVNIYSRIHIVTFPRHIRFFLQTWINTTWGCFKTSFRFSGHFFFRLNNAEDFSDILICKDSTPQVEFKVDHDSKKPKSKLPEGCFHTSFNFFNRTGKKNYYTFQGELSPILPIGIMIWTNMKLH